MTKTVSTIVKSGKKTVVISDTPKKTVVQVADVGLSGPPGGNYTHIQSTPSSVWTITHNLGINPGGISVVDSAGTKVYGDVTFVSVNQLVINFSAGFSGKAYIS